MDELDEAIGKLTAAALQSSPSDDQIIAGHIRDSVALLLKAKHKLHEEIERQREDMRRQSAMTRDAIQVGAKEIRQLRALIARLEGTGAQEIRHLRARIAELSDAEPKL